MLTTVKNEQQTSGMLDNPVFFNEETSEYGQIKRVLPMNRLRIAGALRKCITNALTMARGFKSVTESSLEIIKCSLFCSILLEKYCGEFPYEEIQMLLDLEKKEKIAIFLERHREFLEFPTRSDINYRDTYKRTVNLLDDMVMEDEKKYFQKRKDLVNFTIPGNSINVTLSVDELYKLVSKEEENYGIQIWAEFYHHLEVDAKKEIILCAVCKASGISYEAMNMKKRDRNITQIRGMVWGIAQEMRLINNKSKKRKGEMSLESAGEWLAGRDHSTVLHGIRNHKILLETRNKEYTLIYKRAVREISKELIFHDFKFKDYKLKDVEKLLAKSGTGAKKIKKVLDSLKRRINDVASVKGIHITEACILTGVPHLSF